MLTDADKSAFEKFEKAGWEKAAQAYHDHWGHLTIQSALALLDAANVAAGNCVLDVATGAGYVAAAANERGADATGIDFSSAQVTLAQRTYPWVDFRQGNAEELPFDDASFDAVVMAFGMNHLPNPEKAAAEAFRILKPGGWFAFTVWAQPKPGQGFGIVLSAIEQEGSQDSSLPPAPPYFRFADEDSVTEVLNGCGYTDVTTHETPQHWRHESPDQVFQAFERGSVRATAMLRAQPEDVRERIRHIVREKVEGLFDGEFYVIPVPAALSSGRKPLTS